MIQCTLQRRTLRRESAEGIGTWQCEDRIGKAVVREHLLSYRTHFGFLLLLLFLFLLCVCLWAGG